MMPILRVGSCVILLERRLDIARRLREQGAVTVMELSSAYGVSDETIRRDLKALEREGLVQRRYGGALTNGAVEPVPPVHERQEVHSPEKRWIARLAVQLVTDGQVLKLDAGTTTRALARELKAQGRKAVVVTHDLMVAQELADAPGIDLYLTGGRLERQPMCMLGPQSEAALQLYNADISFVAASGISPGNDCLTTGSVFDAQVKQALMKGARTKVLLVDSSKFQRVAFVTYAPVSAVSTVITDPGIAPEQFDALRAMGIRVLLAGPETEAE